MSHNLVISSIMPLPIDALTKINFLYAACYELQPDHSVIGSILKFDTNYNIIQSLNTPGLLDIQNFNSLLYCASVDGNLYVYSESLDLQQTIQIGSKCLYSSVGDNILAVGLDDGQVYINGDTKQIHEFSVWSVERDKLNNNIVYSGSDDSTLKTLDIRMEDWIGGSNKSHQTGISYIHDWNEYILYTGCFDENLRSFDKRKMNSPISCNKQEGGIWRIRELDKSNLLLGLFNSNKYIIWNIEQQEQQWLVEFGNLTYACLCDDAQLILCSFYDKQFRVYT